jgi:hypothetical protein
MPSNAVHLIVQYLAVDVTFVFMITAMRTGTVSPVSITHTQMTQE